MKIKYLLDTGKLEQEFINIAVQNPNEFIDNELDRLKFKKQLDDGLITVVDYIENTEGSYKIGRKIKDMDNFASSSMNPEFFFNNFLKSEQDIKDINNWLMVEKR